MSLSVISVKSEKKQDGFVLFNEIVSALDKARISIENQDMGITLSHEHILVGFIPGLQSASWMSLNLFLGKFFLNLKSFPLRKLLIF